MNKNEQLENWLEGKEEFSICGDYILPGQPHLPSLRSPRTFPHILHVVSANPTWYVNLDINSTCGSTACGASFSIVQLEAFGNLLLDIAKGMKKLRDQKEGK